MTLFSPSLQAKADYCGVSVAELLGYTDDRYTQPVKREVWGGLAEKLGITEITDEQFSALFQGKVEALGI